MSVLYLSPQDLFDRDTQTVVVSNKLQQVMVDAATQMVSYVGVVSECVVRQDFKIMKSKRSYKTLRCLYPFML